MGMTDEKYYTNDGVSPEGLNWGSYQYVSLDDIVNNYLLMYTGNNSVVNNVNRYLILFHAKRAIQELNYDAFKEVKVLELPISEELRIVLPSDYINWVRVSMYRDGILLPMVENIQTNYAKAYVTDNAGELIFDEAGSVLTTDQAKIVTDRIDGLAKTIYLNDSSRFDGSLGYEIDGRWYFSLSFGARFGLNTETANSNPTFRVDNKSGVINFSSGIEGELCILEYISDGMENGDSSQIFANKLFESYIYAYITYEILKNKLGVQEYIVARARKERMALWRNAKIRVSGMHPGRLLMNMRGMDKVIK